MGQDIDLLLKRHEDKTLEFKRDLSSPDRVIATLVAFANSAGGVVVLGVEDGTRAVAGVSDPTAIEERLPILSPIGSLRRSWSRFRWFRGETAIS